MRFATLLITLLTFGAPAWGATYKLFLFPLSLPILCAVTDPSVPCTAGQPHPYPGPNLGPGITVFGANLSGAILDGAWLDNSDSHSGTAKGRRSARHH